MTTLPRSRALATFSFTAVLALGLTLGPRAWSDDAPAAPPAAPAKPAAVKPPPATLKLLDAGAEPRQALRLRLASGHQEACTTKMTMAGTSNGMPIPVPSFTMAMTFNVQDVNDHGDAHYVMGFGDVKVELGAGGQPGMQEAMDQAFGVLKRAKMAATLSARGELKDMTMELPEDVPDALRASLDSTLSSLKDVGPVVLPEEPIGVGARWQVGMTMSTGGLTLDQTAVYKLTARDGDRYELTYEIQQTGKPQEMHAPNLPPGAKLEVLSLTSKGTGAMAMDLTRIAPSKGSMHMTTAQSMRFTMGEMVQDQAVDMTMDMEMAGQVVPPTTPGR